MAMTPAPEPMSMTAWGAGQHVVDAIPEVISCCPGATGGHNFQKVAVTLLKRGRGGFTATPIVMYDENTLLKKRVKELEGQTHALKEALFHSGSVCNQLGLAGLLPQRGKPVTNPDRKRVKRMMAAQSVVELSGLIQGPDTVTNALEFLEAVAAKDPAIMTRLASQGLLPQVMEEVQDKRYTKQGCKRMRVAPIVSVKNAFLWQAGSRATNQTVHELRRLGGKAVVQTPEQLQAWAAGHPDLPEMKFVLPGSSAVWTPPIALLTTLMSNPDFKASLRTLAPYASLHLCKKTFMWYLVSISPMECDSKQF